MTALPERLRPLAAAITFLTAVPVARGTALGERDVRAGVVLFPLVGAGVGAVVALVAWGAAHVLPPFASAGLGLAAGVTVTAAFHLDGLADLADGIGASLTGRDPSPVMHDPRLGTFGVAAVALDLLVKASVLSTLVTANVPWQAIGAAAVARVAPIVLAWRLRYTGAGTGGWVRDVRGATVAVATILALAVAVPTARLATIGMVAAGAVACAILGRWSRRRLGGVTGDVFGAAAELTDTSSLVVAAALA